tara:strand:+ start:877 stop:1386 length:510 start_codon:yes stop_codon:yes gene_type:complete
MTTHNHGAAVSGTKSEKKLSAVCNKHGIPCLKVKKDFKVYSLDEWGTRYHMPPAHWGQKTPTGKQRRFESDAFLPVGKGIIVEQKNSDKHGTTEEKVFYDKEKIKLGVYGKRHELWYIFTGDVAADVAVYKEFELEAKKANLPVKIIWGWDGLESELKSLNKGDIWKRR